MASNDAPRAVKHSETIYGMHAVRVMLERHADRVLTVRLAEQRDDPRAREIDELARRTSVRCSASTCMRSVSNSATVAHQGVAAEIAPLPPWSEDELLAALQDGARAVAARARWRAGPAQSGCLVCAP